MATERYNIRVLRDGMVGRMAYALSLSTGMFIVLFDHTTYGCHMNRLYGLFARRLARLGTSEMAQKEADQTVVECAQRTGTTNHVRHIGEREEFMFFLREQERVGKLE